jgi:aspartyl protease family protein
MVIKQVLPLFVIAVAIGWFMPSGDPVAGPTDALPAIASVTAEADVDTDADDDVEPLLTDRIELNREADGHFYTDVEVNAGSIRFLVDTGATAVALTGDDARELGLHWSADELGPVARGAGGTVMGKRIVIDRMQLGNVQATNVRAAIIPEGLDVSLLGQTFLSQIDSVNISGDRMVLN